MKTDIKFSVSYQLKNETITQASTLEYTLVKIDPISNPKSGIYFV